MKLDCQAATYGSRAAPSHSSAADAYPEDLAGAVMESSFSFLDLLTTFKATTGDDHNSINNIIRLSTYHCLPSPSASTSIGDSTEGLTSPNTPLRPAPSHNPNPAKPQPVNIMTSLQLLACYMHLIHLHSLLYTATHTYITAHSRSTSAPTSATIASSTASPHPLFPTLQVHGVSLIHPSTYKFQIQLLLQISLDTLSRIKSALGLPQGYGVQWGAGAVGEVEPGGGCGLLELSVSLQLVVVIMCEEGAMGCERIQEIRETVVVLRGELRGEIEF